MKPKIDLGPPSTSHWGINFHAVEEASEIGWLITSRDADNTAGAAVLVLAKGE